MPIYEFQCKSCNYVFELLMMTKEELEEARCPKCQSPEVGKLMSAANISTGAHKAPAPNPNKPSVETRTCQSGSCTYLNLPGYSRD